MGNNASSQEIIAERLTNLSAILFNSSRCKTADVQTILTIDRLKTFVSLCKYEIESTVPKDQSSVKILNLFNKVDSELGVIFSGVEMSSSDSGDIKAKQDIKKDVAVKRPKVVEIHKPNNKQDDEEWGSNMNTGEGDEDSEGNDLDAKDRKSDEKDVKDDVKDNKSKVKIQAPGDISISSEVNKDYISAIGSSIAPSKKSNK
jgi:hypothetical protein